MRNRTKSILWMVGTAVAIFAAWAAVVLNTDDISSLVGAFATGWIIGDIAKWVARKATGLPKTDADKLRNLRRDIDDLSIGAVENGPWVLIDPTLAPAERHLAAEVTLDYAQEYRELAGLPPIRTDVDEMVASDGYFLTSRTEATR